MELNKETSAERAVPARDSGSASTTIYIIMSYTDGSKRRKIDPPTILGAYRSGADASNAVKLINEASPSREVVIVESSLT